MATTPTLGAAPDVARIAEDLYRDGIVGIPGLLPAEWADALDEDLAAEFVRALAVRGGTVPRGWNRFYFEPYAERLRGVLDLVTDPLVTALSERLFGPDYAIVELGCDVPLPGAVNQPWHRDFPMPDETRLEGRLTSIAVNVSGVDVEPDMGPFQVVKGTHFDDDAGFDGGMFPPDDREPDYTARMTSMFGRRGGVSVRTGLAIHRGSESSTHARRRLTAILGIVSPEDRAIRRRLADPGDTSVPRIRMSEEYLATLPEAVRRHISHEVVCATTAELPPHHTDHDFEGLKMSRRD